MKELSRTIPMSSVFLHGSVIGPLMFLLFVRGLQDDLKALTLLFAGDVFSPSAQCTVAVNETWQLVFIVIRYFQDLTNSAFILLYGALVRPHLECGMFAKPRGRYQPFRANSDASYNVGNLHSLRRETAAAGSTFLAVVTITFKTFMSLLDVGLNWYFCLSLGTTLEGTTKRYSKVRVVAGGKGRRFWWEFWKNERVQVTEVLLQLTEARRVECFKDRLLHKCSQYPNADFRLQRKIWLSPFAMIRYMELPL